MPLYFLFLPCFSRLRPFLQVPEATAQRFVAAFHARFPAVKQWAAKVKRECAQQGWVATITGRKRLVPQPANPADGAARARAERQAVNSVVQVGSHGFRGLMCAYARVVI